MSKGNPHATHAVVIGKTNNFQMPKGITLDMCRTFITSMITSLMADEVAKAKVEKRTPYEGIHTVYSGFNSAFEQALGFSPKELLQPAWPAKGIAAGPLAEEFHAHAMRGGVRIYMPGKGPKASVKPEAKNAAAAGLAALTAAGFKLPQVNG